MPSAEVATCNWCHAPIRWTITAAGKRMAVDAEPDDAGNTAVYADGVGTLKSRALTTDRPTLEHAEWRAMPHAATCTTPPPRRPRNSPTRTVRRAPQRWRSR